MRGVVKVKTPQQFGWLTFGAVREAFKQEKIYVHPLNCPINTIEDVCKQTRFISTYEHLGPYNTEKESFPIIVFDDRDKITLMNSLRTKLARFILPK